MNVRQCAVLLDKNIVGKQNMIHYRYFFCFLFILLPSSSSSIYSNYLISVTQIQLSIELFERLLLFKLIILFLDLFALDAKNTRST